ncbi:MAG: ABC transporter permease [candidate division Zixibacteria bacterium]|nr:ABC transporter permease [candidate division Zixibacteria bacterium]
MNKFWTIFKSEYLQVVKKKSFIAGIILTPLFMVAFTMLPAFLASQDVSEQTPYSIVDLDNREIGSQLAEALTRYKLEDDSTIETYPLREIYELRQSDSDSLSSLRRHLDSLILTKSLKRYIVIFPNAESNDSVLMVSKSMNFKASNRYDNRISDILTQFRLKNSNIDLPLDTLLNITHRIDMMQESPGGKTKDFMATYFGALIFVMIIFGSIIGFGQILMRSIIEEKNSRIMEVLISSVSPFQLMMGKVLGLGAANLTQVSVWGAIGFLIFLFRGAVDIPVQVSSIVFNPILIVFFVIYLLIGYIMYSTMFALIGSICTTDKETQNFIFPIVMSLMLPVILLMYIVQQPDSLITIIMSFIPFLTPTMMVARLNIVAPEVFTLSDPIIVEALIGIVTTGLTCLGLIWLTSRIFRMGILMYGKRATIPEIMKWIKYK